MKILSFDTSSHQIALCLMSDSQVTAADVIESPPTKRQESAAMLLPSIDSILKKSGWSKHELDCLVVGQGPGSFTGIRTAVVTARTLAQALRLPLVGINVLDCYAFEVELPAVVVISAGRGHFFFAAFERGRDGERLTEPIVPPSHGTVQVVEDVLSDKRLQSFTMWADDESREKLGDSGHAFEPLPALANVAVSQARIASARLALRISTLGSTIEEAEESSSPQTKDGKNERTKSHLRDMLIKEFPYRKIEPLYLRGASVTLKETDGKKTACN
ncbi:MAG TPA: tRNA (adenosine(37)-N6)-threonylcarbamoyltransferase complex dimerization subunit type 1 TsaB [Candidatus Obscuribacterales bacterium]